jgi:hypothetical protein
MTRPEMIAAVRAVDDAEFQDEVGHHMGIEEREYSYDEVSALFDVEERAETWGVEAATPAQRKAARRLLQVARRVLIGFGYYRVMPAEETFTTSGRSPWAFKLDGIAYTSDEVIDDWQFPPDATDHRTP